jgi:predicted O-methyltransferase YrrM
MRIQSFRASAYLNYLTHRRTIQYIHSPFLFELMKVVFDDSSKNRKPYFKEIELKRRALMNDKTIIQFNDLGAGADSVGKIQEVQIGAIAKRSLKQAKYARLLNRLIHYLKADRVVELGTSLGITSLYLAEAAKNVYTIEGDISIRRIAKTNWNHDCRIHSYVFDLNESWEMLSDKIGNIDLLFIDANHRKEAMIRYYLQGRTNLHERSVVVLDDIHWNEEALEAWNILRNREEVTLSFDIFQMGFLFFDKRLSKEHFTLKY